MCLAPLRATHTQALLKCKPTHALRRTCACSCTHEPTDPDAQSCMHTLIIKCTDVHTPGHTHSHLHTFISKFAGALTQHNHTCTCANTQTHMHTYALMHTPSHLHRHTSSPPSQAGTHTPPAPGGAAPSGRGQMMRGVGRGGNQSWFCRTSVARGVQSGQQELEAARLLSSLSQCSGGVRELGWRAKTQRWHHPLALPARAKA